MPDRKLAEPDGENISQRQKSNRMKKYIIRYTNDAGTASEGSIIDKVKIDGTTHYVVVERATGIVEVIEPAQLISVKQ